MTPRQTQILNFIIKEYVKTAEPVSSGLLSEKYTLNISPATIRSEMLELENLGYLTQTHTSAGRTPTDKAYRFFVNNLLEGRQICPLKEREYVKSRLKETPKNPHLISKIIAETVSNVSKNMTISGITETGEFFKVGLYETLEMPEFREYERILRIVSVFDEFENYLGKLFGGMTENSPSVLIGGENGIGDIYDETLMSVHYSLPGNFEGVTAIVGPIRMNYERNIALLDYVSRLMNKNFSL